MAEQFFIIEDVRISKIPLHTEDLSTHKTEANDPFEDDIKKDQIAIG